MRNCLAVQMIARSDWSKPRAISYARTHTYACLYVLYTLYTYIHVRDVVPHLLQSQLTNYTVSRRRPLLGATSVTRVTKAATTLSPKLPIQYSPSGHFNIRRRNVSVKMLDVRNEIPCEKVISLLSLRL